MLEFTAASGASVVINDAPFEDVMKLKRAAMREAALMGGQISIPSLLMVGGSETADALLWPCLNRCLYNKEKIIKATFNAVETRKDYYEIVAAFIKVNILPLVESLHSQLQEHGLTMQANTVKSQSSESTTTAPSSP